MTHGQKNIKSVRYIYREWRYQRL